MGDRAAIYVLRAFPADRQTAACSHYITEEHWTLWAIVPPWAPGDAVALARDGTVSVVVAAFDSRAVEQLAADLPPTCRVEVVHPTPHVVEPPRHRLGSVEELVGRWFRHGRPPKQIAHDLDENTEEINDVLRRLGLLEQNGREY